MTETEKLIGGGIVTLLVGFVSFQLQQGGRRRRLRREIREELELLRMLADDTPVARRLRERINTLLDRYAPALPESPKLGGALFALGAGAAALGVVISTALPDLPFWTYVVTGAGVGLFAAGVGAYVDSRHERRVRRRAMWGTD